MKKLKNETFTTDKETGEVTTVTKTFTIQAKSENFYSTFIDNMSGYFRITCVTDCHVLAKLCDLAEFNTGVVNMTTQRRRQILDELSISSQNLSNSLRRLKDLSLITGAKGTYTINPSVFWKGTLDQRRKIMEAGLFEINISLQ